MRPAPRPIWEARREASPRGEVVMFFERLKRRNYIQVPEPAPVEGACWVSLTCGRWALIDEADYELVSGFTWWFNPVPTKDNPSNGYARACVRVDGKTKRMYMHSLLTGLKGVDHRDRNPLNNRRANLRSCTQSQNLCNRPLPEANKSGFRGVSWYKRDACWRATVKVSRRQIHLGYFVDLAEAARAYDRAAIAHHGEFAVLNFPQERG